MELFARMVDSENENTKEISLFSGLLLGRSPPQGGNAGSYNRRITLNQ